MKHSQLASGLWVPDDDKGDPDKIAMNFLRDAMNDAAVECGASDMALVATVALLGAQLCHKHAGADVVRQDKFIADLVGAIDHSLRAQGFRP